MELAHGNTFDSPEDVRSALSAYSVRVSAPYVFKTNKPRNFCVVCPFSDVCDFVTSANRRKGGLMHVVKFRPNKEGCPSLEKPFHVRGRALAKLACSLPNDCRPMDLVSKLNRTGVQVSLAEFRNRNAATCVKCQEAATACRRQQRASIKANLGNVTR